MPLKNIKNLFFISIIFVATVAYGGVLKKADNYANDATITTAVKAKFLKDKLLSPFDIAVETHKQVVSLQGQVNSSIQYKRAVIDAVTTQGVKLVKADNLTIKDSDIPLRDLFIIAQAEAYITKYNLDHENIDIDLTDIEIEANDGLVYAHGLVNNYQQKKQIIKILGSIAGVKQVKTDLKIA